MKKQIKEQGVVFTPKYICEFMCSFIPKEIPLKILEPSCGEGAFLNELINNKNYDNKNCDNIIYANDISSSFVEKCKKEFNNVKYSVKDYINFEPNEKYDIIIGNPPYIRIQNLNETYKNAIKNEFSLITGNLDMYHYFILKSIKLINNTGKLIFIIPNSFLYNKSSSHIKQFLLDNKLIEYIIDFKERKIFNGISVYTCIIVINKVNKNDFYYYSNDILGNYKKVPFIKETNIGNPLKDIKLTCGIATLCDSVFIIKDYTEDNQFIYFNKNKIEKGILKKILKVSKNKIYYIIYPYNNGIILDDLNDYPECYNYLLKNKKLLDNRDKGKKVYEKWYAFGRKQGISLNEKNRLFISSLTKDIKYSLITENVPLFYSGLCIESLQEIETTKKLLVIYEKQIINNCNVKSGGWYTINKSSFEIN
jgi:adenine-specific DNA-methyltransferase